MIVSCAPYIVSFAVLSIASAVISGVFIYYYRYSKKNNDQSDLKKDTLGVKYSATETLIY